MAVAAIKRLVKRGQPPQLVFVPTRFNIHEMNAAYELALDLGCSAFVTGPLMRLGRAAHDWDRISCSDDEWQRAVDQLRERANSISAKMALSIYPWDIVTEMERRIENPQAMLLIVPNGKVKLLNALPFSPADLRRDSLEHAWQAYLDAWRSTEVREFVAGCRADQSGCAMPTRHGQSGPLASRYNDRRPCVSHRFGRFAGCSSIDLIVHLARLPFRYQSAAPRQ